MKKVLAIFMVLAMLAGCVALTACGKKDNNDPTDSSDQPSKTDAVKVDDIPDTMNSTDGKYVIAMVTDVGQLKDKSFNQGTWNGVKLYASQNSKSYKYYQPANDSNANDEDRYNAFVAAITGGAEIIVTPGFLQEAALKRVAAEYPDVKFVFIDGYPLQDAAGNDLKNIAAVAFKEEQCGYLAGYAAVVEGNTKLGFTGGGAGTNPAVNRYGYGFVQGIQDAAKAANVKCEVNYSYLYGTNYSASAELQTMVSGWYSAGTECVFACGGSMCNSVFAAAAAENAFSIGVDVDQAEESTTVITSAMKGLAAATQKILGAYFDGKWDTVGGVSSNLGVDDDAVGLPFETSRFNKFTKDEYQKIFDSMKTGGGLTVKDDYTDFLANKVEFENVTVNFIA